MAVILAMGSSAFRRAMSTLAQALPRSRREISWLLCANIRRTRKKPPWKRAASCSCPELVVCQDRLALKRGRGNLQFVHSVASVDVVAEMHDAISCRPGRNVGEVDRHRVGQLNRRVLAALDRLFETLPGPAGRVP